MIIDTSTFSQQLPGLAAATLNESTDAPATLELRWAGYGPDWLDWMAPVTLMHRGRVLFHGCVTSFERGFSATDGAGCSATVTNALWLLDNLPLGAQVAEWEAASSGATADYKKAGAAATGSWVSLAESCRVEAPGWLTNAAGDPRGNGVLQLDVDEAGYSAGAPYRHEGAVTAWTALLDMQRANPDAVFTLDYVSGNIRVRSIANCEKIAWDTEEMGIKEISGVSPQYANCITGILLLVRWEGERGSGNLTLKYPEDLPPTADRVKMFTATSDTPQHAQQQLGYLGDQLRRYYEAVNLLQWGGSITVLMQDVEESPIGKRLSLQGKRTHASWHDMAAIVTGVTWDFLERTVQVTLGKTCEEPELVELEFPEASATLPPENTTHDGDIGDGGDDDNTTDDGETPPVRDDTTEDGSGSEGTNDDTGCGCEHNGGGGGVSESQKVFNAVFYKTFFGDTHFITCLYHHYPSIFPDWFQPSMTEEEITNTMMQNAEIPPGAAGDGCKPEDFE